MQTKCVSADAPIPDGTYDGVWGGYEVSFNVGDTTHHGRTKVGIITPSIGVTVTAKDREVSVQVKCPIEVKVK